MTRNRAPVAAFVALLVLPALLGPSGCKTVHGDCEEDERADPSLDRRLELMLAGESVLAELADTPSARTNPWAYRRCDLEGILLVPEARGPYPLSLCRLQTEVDLAFILDGAVEGAVEFAPPCRGPCEQCPVYGEHVEQVDSVLMLVPDLSEFHTGDVVDGLP